LIRPTGVFTADFLSFFKFTIRSNSRKFPKKFHVNSKIPGNSQREFRVA